MERPVAWLEARQIPVDPDRSSPSRDASEDFGLAWNEELVSVYSDGNFFHAMILRRPQ